MAAFDPFDPRLPRPIRLDDETGLPVAVPTPRPVVRRPSLLVPLLCVLVGLCLCVQVGQLIYTTWFRPTATTYYPPITPRGDLAEDEKATIQLYNTIRPSVVHITNVAVRNSGGIGFNVQKVPEGSGTGIVWDDQGNIVTNFHVVQNADEVVVTLADQTSWQATVVGTHADKDLAVVRIRVDKAHLRPIPVGTSADLQVGQKTFAIGNPFGLDQTLTTGVISALNREIESVTKRPIRGVIQTDAAINPGNSGGPLLDSAGRLIGVNTAIFSPSGTSAGIGFAIPVDEVRRVVPQLIESGKVLRPTLGVQVAADQLAKELRQEGALVIAVQPDSPAEKAGLRPTRRAANGKLLLGDVITAIDGQAVRNANDLFDVLDAHRGGDTVKLTVRRDGKSITLEATLTTPE